MRPVLAASALKKAKAVADFKNFVNFILSSLFRFQPLGASQKHYCCEPYIAGAGAKKSSLGKGSSQFATRREAGTRSTVLTTPNFGSRSPVVRHADRFRLQALGQTGQQERLSSREQRKRRTDWRRQCRVRRYRQYREGRADSQFVPIPQPPDRSR